MKITRRHIATFLIAILLVAVVVAVYVQGPGRQSATSGGAGGRFARSGDQGVPTLAGTTTVADVPVYFDGVGSTKALNTVTVRAQVDGKLLAINFKEGQDVERGFILAKIDPTLYQAQFDQAVAKKAQDEALLSNARHDLDRYVKLVATNALAAQQSDTQRALVAQYEAQVQADQAAIDNQRATLDYTNITAPLDGRTGIRLVDVGNIIHASDTTGVVVITQIRPISVIFTLPQQQFGQVNTAFSKGPLPVDVFGIDNKTVIDSGTLVVVDNQVDPATGTIKLKAEFPNATLQQWPGMFVTVRLLVNTLKQVVVAPTAAVQRGPNGTFVFVIGDDNIAKVQPVTITQQDENQTVIASGLQAGQKVATTGFNLLTDGAKVVVGVDTRNEPIQTPAARPRGGSGGVGGQQGQQGQQRQRDGGQQGQPPSGDGQRPQGGGQRRGQQDAPPATPAAPATAPPGSQ